MKRSLFFILLLTCLLAVFAVTASAEVFEGKAVDEQWIRDNEGTSQEFEDGNILNVAPYYRIWYKLDTETGKLYLYPKGADQKMLPYARFEWVPWLKAEDPNVQRPFILEAELEYGVLTVGRYSFYQCENLHTVYLPSSIYKIDQTVFYECPSLETVHYAGTKEDFEKYVLFDKTRNDEALDKFVFGESVTVIAKNQHGDVLEEYIVGGYAVGDSYSFLPKKYEGMTYTGDPYKAITGTFVENDQTVYELIYECNHSYQSVSEDKPCISRCVYCKHDNPNSLHVFNDEGTIPCVGVCRLCNELYENENGQHQLDGDPEDHLCRYTCSICNQVFDDKDGKHDKRKVDEPSSLFKSGQTGWKCTRCGANELEGKNPVIFYLGIVLVAIAATVVIFLAIFLPIRRKKKIKDMTW